MRGSFTHRFRTRIRTVPDSAGADWGGPSWLHIVRELPCAQTRPTPDRLVPVRRPDVLAGDLGDEIEVPSRRLGRVCSGGVGGEGDDGPVEGQGGGRAEEGRVA